MACDEVDSGSVVFLVIDTSVEVADELSLFVAEYHLSVFGSVTFPFFFVESGNFVVYLFLDILLMILFSLLKVKSHRRSSINL